MTLRVRGDEIGVSPGVFAQANVLLHEELATAVVESAGRGRSLVELFAGAGFFTIALARRFSRVWAVESQRDAVRDLVSNLRRAQVENVEVLRSRVERLRSTSIPEEPDVVVLDPPRTGLPRHAAGRLAALRARRIVYVSCDPATLSRDLAQLRDGGYALASVRGFDLFPQTAHVEALAVLDLEGR